MKKNMKQKQKLDRRDTYTPTDAPQVRGSVILSLNRDQSLSEQNLKTLSNNPDVDLLPPAGGHNANTLVFVLNDDGKPLMPCKPAKARHLLRDRKARVSSSNPFTIRLLWHCEEKSNLSPSESIPVTKTWATPP